MRFASTGLAMGEASTGQWAPAQRSMTSRDRTSDRQSLGADVVVHVHPALPLWPNSLVAQLLPLWRARGLRTRVVAGPTPVGSGRVGILHVDLTRVPSEYESIRPAYSALLNGTVTDIGKRRLAAELTVERSDPYDGPVIVKTDLNAGGVPERMARRRGQAWPARAAGTLLDHLFPHRPTGRWWHRDRPYPIYPRKSAVPSWVWRRTDLLVQRFVREPARPGYTQRIWVFLADVDFHLARHTSDLRLPHERATDAVLLDEVPTELRVLRTSWGFDLGKFDYVLSDGKPVLLDANKTPSFGLDATPFHRAALPRLAEGIQRWL